MNLSADQFCDVLNGLKRPHGTSDGTPNRRRGQRVTQLGWAEISMVHPKTTDREGSVNTVTVHDVSVRGIGVLQDHAFQKGDQFIIKLNRLDQTPLPLLYTVANNRKIADDLFAIGAELSKILPDDEVEAKNLKLDE